MDDLLPGRGRPGGSSAARADARSRGPRGDGCGVDGGVSAVSASGRRLGHVALPPRDAAGAHPAAAVTPRGHACPASPSSASRTRTPLSHPLPPGTAVGAGSSGPTPPSAHRRSHGRLRRSLTTASTQSPSRASREHAPDAVRRTVPTAAPARTTLVRAGPTGARHHAQRRSAISAPTPASWAYAEAFVAEDDVLARARAPRRRGRLPRRSARGWGRRCGSWPPRAARGRWSRSAPAPASRACGCCAGCAPTACSPPSTSRPSTSGPRARRSPRAASAPKRARLITGRALDVLPRLTDGAYDLVFCDADGAEYAAYLDQALRLLRPGGVVAFDNALWHDRVADPAQRDAATTADPRAGQAGARRRAAGARAAAGG